MTRPRICSPAASWTEALAAVVKVRTAAPVGTSNTAKLASVGIRPAVASSTPNANAAPTSKRIVGRSTASRQHRTDQRSERYCGDEGAVGRCRAAELAPGGQGQRHREVQAQRADEADEDDRQQELPARDDVAQPRAQLPAGAQHRAGRAQLVPVHGKQRGEHRKIGRGIGAEDGGAAHNADEDPRKSRTRDTSGVERHAVQRDRVR